MSGIVVKLADVVFTVSIVSDGVALDDDGVVVVDDGVALVDDGVVVVDDGVVVVDDGVVLVDDGVVLVNDGVVLVEDGVVVVDDGVVAIGKAMDSVGFEVFNDTSAVVAVMSPNRRRPSFEPVGGFVLAVVADTKSPLDSSAFVDGVVDFCDSAADTGVSGVDAFVSVVDASTFAVDAGAFVLSAGVSVMGAGAFVVDAGAFVVDAGAFVVDAGDVSVVDAGVSVVDAGGVSVVDAGGVSVVDAGVVGSFVMISFSLEEFKLSASRTILPESASDPFSKLSECFAITSFSSFTSLSVDVAGVIDGVNTPLGKFVAVGIEYRNTQDTDSVSIVIDLLLPDEVDTVDVGKVGDSDVGVDVCAVATPSATTTLAAE